ncbi:MAG: acyltransferase [Methylotenera sp.]|nr:acyltransferase [Oligoflexia bacterium]
MSAILRSGRDFSSLTGLRTLFIIWVMFSHAPTEVVPPFLRSIQTHWTFGVDGFLAISGFLVTRSLMDCQNRWGDVEGGLGRNRTAVLEYLVRRVSRIWPPYFAMLGFLGIFGYFSQGAFHQQLIVLGNSLISFPLFFANYTMAPVHGHIPLILQAYWSISYQEQFYLLILLLLALNRKRWVPVLIVATLGSIFVRVLTTLRFEEKTGHAFQLETFLHLNLDAMGWGCIAWLAYEHLSFLWSRPRRAWISTGVILSLLILSIALRSFATDDFSRAMLSTIRAPLLALLVRMICEFDSSNLPPIRLLKSRLMQTIGKATYEIFLLHIVVYAVLQKTPLKYSPWFLSVSYPISFAVGYLAYRGFGLPAQRWLKMRLRGPLGLSRNVSSKGTGASVCPPRTFSL